MTALQVVEARDRFRAQLLALQAPQKAARNLVLRASIRIRSARSAAALEVADVDGAPEALAEEDAIAVEAQERADVTDLDHDNEDNRSCHILMLRNPLLLIFQFHNFGK